MAVHLADDNNHIYDIWIQALTIAVPKYLEDKRLIPDECSNAVVIVSSNMGEAGGGVTAFRCKN